MQASEEKITEDITVLPISFGNPSNEIIHGQLRLSQDKTHANKTVAMINIPTEIDLKEIFAFLQKSNSSLKMSHMKILNQENTDNNSDPSESYYCALCSFKTPTHSEIFIKDLNGQCFNAELSPNKCSIFYLINNIIIVQNNNDDDKYKKMHFPPNRITTAHLIKQNSNPKNNMNGTDEDEANCAFCFDSVEPPFTPATSPHKFGLHRDTSDSPFKLFPSNYLEHDETPSLSCTPPPYTLQMIENIDPKWYDTDATVCFVLCGHFFHVMCLMRCEQNSCPICRHYLFPESSSICNTCNLCTKDLWICLTCGHVGCGRFSNQCALKHYNSTSHIWAKCLTTSHVWDYADDDYVYRILMAENTNENGQTKMVSLYPPLNDGIDGSTKQLPNELDIMSSVKQEEFIYEYNFELHNRLNRIQSFHKSKKNRIIKINENNLNKLDIDRGKIEKDIENKKKNNIKLLNKYKKNLYSKSNNELKPMEFVNDIEYLRKQLNDERDRNEKLKKMIHNVFIEQKTFNEKLKEYENTLKKSFTMTESTLNNEINTMKNELRDYKAHVDTANKMKKTATTEELNNAQISVKPGKSKNNMKRELKNKPHSNKKVKKTRKNRK